LSSSNMFGCANIRNKQYCILNKQYTKEEYQELKAKIIRDMDEKPYRDKLGRIYKYGEFFPAELGLFGYNESYASDFFPLIREQAEKQGFSWYNPAPNPHKPTITSENIPDSINDVSDSILKEIIECGECKKPFRVMPAELDLLRRFNLPIPRKCPNCRYKERFSRINPPRLYHGACQCNGEESEKRTEESGIYKNATTHFHNFSHCPNEFETSYAPDRPDIVYCESCYQNEVV